MAEGGQYGQRVARIEEFDRACLADMQDIPGADMGMSLQMNKFVMNPPARREHVLAGRPFFPWIDLVAPSPALPAPGNSI